MKHYAQRDTETLCNLYLRHVEAMTAEKLHEKSAIAAELAHRDATIDELRTILAVFLDQVDGDVRATQWFDNRLLSRAKAALSR